MSLLASRAMYLFDTSTSIALAVQQLLLVQHAVKCIHANNGERDDVTSAIASSWSEKMAGASGRPIFCFLSANANQLR